MPLEKNNNLHGGVWAQTKRYQKRTWSPAFIVFQRLAYKNQFLTYLVESSYLNSPIILIKTNHPYHQPSLPTTTPTTNHPYQQPPTHLKQRLNSLEPALDAGQMYRGVGSSHIVLKVDVSFSLKV